MANTVHFRRPLCAAVDSIGFEHQLDVFVRDRELSASSALALSKITTANVGIHDGMLMAEFSLNDDMFGSPDEIIVSSLIAAGASQSGVGESTSLKLTAIVVERNWPLPVDEMDALRSET